MLIALVQTEYLPATHEVVLTTKCPVCGEHSCTTVKAKDFERWTDPNGSLIQDAFPYLDKYQREVLISGICPPCWEKLFGGEQ